MDTLPVMILKSDLGTFPIIRSLTIGAQRRIMEQGDKNREIEVPDDKKRLPSTVQVSPLMMIYGRNAHNYPLYMAKGPMICQGGEYPLLVTVHCRLNNV